MWEIRVGISILALVLLAGACGSGSDVAQSASTDPPVTPGATTIPQADGIAVVAADLGSEQLCEPAPQDTESIFVMPPWADGVEREIEVELYISNTRNSGPPFERTTPGRLAVQSENAESRTFLAEVEQWVIDDVGLSSAAKAEFDAVVHRVGQERIEYVLGTDGSWQGVANVDEIRRFAQDLIDGMVQIVPAGSRDADIYPRLGDMYDSWSDEGMGSMFSEEPRIYHIFDGWQLPVGEPIEIVGEMPNVFGGRPFPATTVMSVTDLIDEQGCVSLEMVTTPDAEEFVMILAESVGDSFGAEIGEALPELIRRQIAATFEIEVRVEAQYEWGGFMQRVSSTKLVIDGDNESINGKTIVDVTSR